MPMNPKIKLLLLICMGQIVNSTPATLLIHGNELDIDGKSISLPLSQELQCGQGWTGEGPEENPTSGRIISGRDAKPGELPFQVRLGVRTLALDLYLLCGGVLIDEQTILTAAHCVKLCRGEEPEFVNTDNIQAVLGDYSQATKDGEIVLKVSDIIVHKDHSCYVKGNDIALLRLAEPIGYKLTSDGYGSINRVCMPEVGAVYEAGESVMVAGWGLTEPAGNTSALLQVARVEIIDEAQCQEAFEGDFVPAIGEGQLCTSDPSGAQNTCQGDSGGPLIRLLDDGRYELVGLVSFGRSDCRSVGVFTHISYYWPWIVAHRDGKR